jgi:glutamate-1-semialdehyde 2,1-aminomutase
MRVAGRSPALVDDSNDPIIFSRGSGFNVWDTKNQRYVDLICGYGPVVLGHADKEFCDLTSGLMTRGLHFPGYGELHYELAAMFPARADDWGVGFFKSSSESVAAAVRLCRRRSLRTSIIRCGYIGWLDGQYVPGMSWHRPPHLRPQLSAQRPNELTWTDNDLTTLDSILEEDTCACLVLDAYQASYSAVSAIEFLDIVVAMCHNRGCLVVLDETKTAGRTDEQGLWTRMNTPADFIVTGKAIANGAPLSLLLIPEFDPDEFRAARVGGTYSKESYSIAAAIATARLMKARGGALELARIGMGVVRCINRGFSSAGALDLVSAVPIFGGAMFDLVFGSAVERDDQRRQDLVSCITKSGVLMLQSHPNFVSMAHHRLLDTGILEAQLSTATGSWLAGFQDTAFKN